ncbi:MAG: hypothetical protein A2Z14_10970 [Chloroflexi bacterium RBG_16_48_8]|nr:MAG: hypothetical protein A2Z14_10970 [Chloroflexi bacterium RBG_16_48_8]
MISDEDYSILYVGIKTHYRLWDIINQSSISMTEYHHTWSRASAIPLSLMTALVSTEITAMPLIKHSTSKRMQYVPLWKKSYSDMADIPLSILSAWVGFTVLQFLRSKDFP